jgi:hypothetical protein
METEFWRQTRPLLSRDAKIIKDEVRTRIDMIGLKGNVLSDIRGNLLDKVLYFKAQSPLYSPRRTVEWGEQCCSE